MAHCGCTLYDLASVDEGWEEGWRAMEFELYLQCVALCTVGLPILFGLLCVEQETSLYPERQQGFSRVQYCRRGS
jgi:hypothetical protein